MVDKNVIMKELLEEEKTEEQMIKIYSSLLDLGVDKNIKYERREESVNLVAVLRDESIKHKNALIQIISQYE